MSSHFSFLHYLHYMNQKIGFQVDTINENCQLFKSGSALQFFNRVVHHSIPTHAQVEGVKASFGIDPFTWVVSATDTESQKILEAEGLVSKGSFPAMRIDLTTLPTTPPREEVVIKAIDLQGPDIEEWATIVAQTFNMQQSELKKVILRFSEQLIPGSLVLYLAYYQGTPAATGMLLKHDAIASLHWIGTLPEFRKKGLGFAVSHTLLSDTQRMGCKQALLLSSTSGKPLYERLGFKEYHLYTIFSYGAQSMAHH